MSAPPAANSPVLVAATAPALRRQPQGKSHVIPWHGGNGFVWNGSSIVMTSATWLADVIRFKPQSSSNSVPTGVGWELADAETVFHVIWENTPDHAIQSTPTKRDNVLPHHTKHDAWRESGLTVAEAEITAVHVLSGVYRCLEQQIHSLNQWRCELERRKTGGSGEVEEREGAVKFVSLESLLLPLSCVVFLRVKSWPMLPTTPPRFVYVWSCLPVDKLTFDCVFRCVYQPRVGDKLVSIHTPFGSFCPEIFHNTMTSGCVCKLIGQSSGVHVFLTDTCHLPGTEGAGLRRHMSQ